MLEIFFCIVVSLAPADATLTWANYSNGNWDIYLHDNRHGITRLTDTPQDEYYPRFSPDGEKIYFIRENNGKRSIHRMNSKGEVDNWKIDNAGHFSLVGNSKMIFESYEKRWAIKWIDFKTGAITYDGLNDIPQLKSSLLAQPDVTSDGSEIFFLTNRQGWIVESVSKERLRAIKIGGGCRPAVSPDSRYMAYVSNRGHGGTSIRVINRGSGEEVKTIDLPGELSVEYDPKFSNDGKWLVFSVCPNNQHYAKRGAQYQVYIYKWGSNEPPKPLIDLPGADKYPDIFIK